MSHISFHEKAGKDEEDNLLKKVEEFLLCFFADQICFGTGFRMFQEPSLITLDYCFKADRQTDKIGFRPVTNIFVPYINELL